MSEVSTQLAFSTLPEQRPQKRDADYVFYELTRSICSECEGDHAKTLPRVVTWALTRQPLQRSGRASGASGIC